MKVGWRKGWEGFLNAAKPEFHIHQENNFDIKKILQKNEELIRLNEQKEGKILALVNSNKILVSELEKERLLRKKDKDNWSIHTEAYERSFMVLSTYVDDPDATRQIEGILQDLKNKNST